MVTLKLFEETFSEEETIHSNREKNRLNIFISDSKDIKILLAKEYRERLRDRPLRPDLQNIKQRRKLIFQTRLNQAIKNKSPDWNISEINFVLSNLKNNISRDHEGFLNELFKFSGEDIKHSFIQMFNRLKDEQKIPLYMLFALITTIPKRGLNSSMLTDERGIFRCSVIRTILMRLIYNRNYKIIDNNMSDCNIGGRKGKGCRNNLFIINGIIHDVLSSTRKKPVLLQIYDYSQMFDGINLEEAICDMFEVGVRDDSLGLLYEANREIKMSVKTQYGLTEKQFIP